MTCATLNGIIEALEDEKLDVLILDRGLFDGLVWLDWQEKILRLSHEEATAFRSFILTPKWRDLIDIVFVMYCDSPASLEREHAKQITRRTGSIMNQTTLDQLREHYLDAIKAYKRMFKSIEAINNTKRGKEMSIITDVAKRVLKAFRSFADEEVLCIPADVARANLEIASGEMITSKWGKLKRLINRHGAYIPRSKVEKNDKWLQIVPICVLRHDKTFLTNQRHEPGESLHDTLANWAGGHVRAQDQVGAQSKWSSVEVGLRRELKEELALVNLSHLQPIGLVHGTEDARAARHLGIVFQGELSDEKVAASLSDKVIKERPDRYVRTKWMYADQLRDLAAAQKDWSKAITARLLPIG